MSGSVCQQESSRISSPRSASRKLRQQEIPSAEQVRGALNKHRLDRNEAAARRPFSASAVLLVAPEFRPPRFRCGISRFHVA